MLRDIRAKEVKAFNNCLLLIKFTDGSVKIYNCHNLLQDKLYEELSDLAFFKTVHIDEMGIICWDNALDIHPDAVYEDSIALENFHF